MKLFDNQTSEQTQWVDAVKRIGISTSSINSQTTNEFYNFLVSYSEQVEDYNQTHIFDLLPLSVIKKSETINLKKYKTIKGEDKDLVRGIKYVYEPGEHGASLDYTIELNINNQIKQIEVPIREVKPVINRYEIKGSQDKQTSKQAISSRFEEMMAAFTNNEATEIKSTFVSPIEEYTSSQLANKLQSLTVEEVDFIKQSFTDISAIPIGQILVSTNQCNDQGLIAVNYNALTSNYTFVNPTETINQFCSNKTLHTEATTYVTCHIQSCLTISLDKQTSLADSYAPEDLQTIAPFLDIKLIPEAAAAFKDLNQAALNLGFTIQINSAYRSHEQQQQLFDSRLQTAISSGLTLEDSIEQVKSTTAMPGHSEHHLGTALDISCQSCSNSLLYKFIEDNAHLYGFVLSYPEGGEDSTGYIYEPWHIRYIGVDLATELFELNQGENKMYLNEFLGSL